ncbi:MAG TPA: calcium-binding protein [Solirubrobacteraceae bacterium]|nr:calcium-binding protein [Solirubrobacteraceae bacterium]
MTGPRSHIGRRGRLLVLPLLAPLALAPPAAAHSVMKVDGSAIHYTANDDVSLNDLTVTFATHPTGGDAIRFRDPGADGGITASDCDPGELDSQGNPIEYFCPRSGITTVRIDVGEAQDRITAELALNVIAVGGTGADTILTGDGADTVNGGAANDTIRSGGGNDQLVGDAGDDNLTGGAGDDVLQGAFGTDTLDAGAGNDDVRVRDGAFDRALCGEGTDQAQADDRDEVEAACESVDRQATAAPPPDQGGPGPGPGPGPGDQPPPGAAPDVTPPRLRAGGSTLQRVGRRARIVVLATATEASELVAGGYVTMGDNRLALRAGRGNVRFGGGGAQLTLTLSARDARRLRRFLARRRKAHATISVVATDTAGNSSSTRLPRIALRR